MSYILDALKKAEADRDPDARASLAMAQHDRRRNRWLAYAVVVALIANAAILLWLFLPEDDATPPTAVDISPAPAQPPRPEPVERLRPPPANVSPTAQPQAARPVQRPRRTEPAAISPPAASAPPGSVAAAEGETIIGPNSALAPASEPVPVSSLPEAQRRRFPNLEFSTHIYADDPDLRAIVVNGSRLEEGDRLQDLELSQITEEGAVFRFEGRLVSVSVLDNWN
jgi:type IV secretory pathway VirB10-like protein